jgi:CheY-like chemotaxis protein
MAASQDVLNSWKEIARYLDRGVRTVQRWEAELGLPVRRPRGRERTAVIALRADIDAWLKACPIVVRNQSLDFGPALELGVRPGHGRAQPQTSAYVLQSRRLRADLQRLQQEVLDVAGRLLDACQRLRPETNVGRAEQRELLAWTQSTMAEVAPPKILVIDDNEIQSYVMSKTLELAGFAVNSVHSGDVALALMKDTTPDAVVLDVNMPEMNGFEVCSRIKQDPRNRDVPVIFYTSSGPAGRDHAEGLGATAFLTYPMNPDQLTRVISTSIARNER